MILRLLKRYKQSSRADRGLFFRALALVALMRIGLRVLPYRVTQKWVEHFRTSAGLGRDLERREIRRVVWAVEAASRRFPGTTCLPKGLTTYLLLGRLGQDSQLRLGVAHNEKGQFEAHAWVEVHGRVVIGVVDGFERFVPLQTQRCEKIPA